MTLNDLITKVPLQEEWHFRYFNHVLYGKKD